MNIRIKNFSFATLFAVASLVSFYNIFLPATANAALAPANDNDRALSYSYYKIMEACFNKSNITKDIDASKKDSPSEWVNDSWGGVNSEVKTGFMVNPEGKEHCKQLVPKAISFWQITPLDFLKGVGYTLNDDGTKYTRSSNQNSDYTNYITRVIPGTNTETPLIKYTLDYNALIKGCSPTALGPLADIKDEATLQQIKSGTNSYFQVTLANANGSTTVHAFKDGKESINNYGAPGSDVNNSSYFCRDKGIAANISSAARSLATATSNNLYTTLGNTLYSSLGALRNAECNAYPNKSLQTECQDGWKNSFNKCYANYQNAASAGAQDSPTGSTSTFAKPTKAQTNTLALCIASATGAPGPEVLAALDGALTGFQEPSSNSFIQPVTTETDDKTSCAIEGIGWIVCPVAGFLGMLTDGLFAVLTTLLSFTPVRENEATYDTWQAMRNIANAAFVIAFLIIIFSQLTGAGITNYGIKKMVPRLIAAAILVNISFFICQIAVDLSNILGYSLQSLMTNASKTASGSSNSLDIWGDLVGWIIAGAGGTLAVGSTVLTIGAAGGWIPALALLLPVLVTVLFAVLTVVLVLAARQALIIILIVISPLAFVAYLLPNTEDWFHKWRKLFITLLLMFPIISVIFGGSQLAAAVIRAGTNNPLIYILSLAVQVIPFFLVPIIMKTAGGLLNRFGGIVNNPNKGPFDKLRKSAQGYGDMQRNRGRANQLERYERDRQSGNKSTVGAVTRWQMRRRTEQTGVENVLKKAEAGYVAQQIKDSEEFRNKAAGGSRGNPASSAAQNAVLASAVSALDKMEDEEASNAEKLMRHGKDPNQMIDIAAAELTTAIQNNDVTKGLAAQRILRNSGNKGLDKLHATLESNVTTEQQKTSDVVRNLRSDINSAGLKGKNNVLTSWSYGAGTQTLADAASDPGTLSGLTDTELAGQSLDKALKAAPQGTISQTQAQSIIDNQNIWKDIDENKKAFFEQVAGRPSIHRQTTPTPSATPAAPTAPGFEQTDSGLFIPRDRE